MPIEEGDEPEPWRSSEAEPPGARRRNPALICLMRELPEDLESKLGYRMAYGEAARQAEVAPVDHG
jgi:hypothetical protein